MKRYNWLFSGKLDNVNVDDLLAFKQKECFGILMKFAFTGNPHIKHPHKTLSLQTVSLNINVT
jgi:hypothetical protein